MHIPANHVHPEHVQSVHAHAVLAPAANTHVKHGPAVHAHAVHCMFYVRICRNTIRHLQVQNRYSSSKATRLLTKVACPANMPTLASDTIAPNSLLPKCNRRHCHVNEHINSGIPFLNNKCPFFLNISH